MDMPVPRRIVVDRRQVLHGDYPNYGIWVSHGFRDGTRTRDATPVDLRGRYALSSTYCALRATDGLRQASRGFPCGLCRPKTRARESICEN
jgi:hypothetical protein